MSTIPSLCDACAQLLPEGDVDPKFWRARRQSHVLLGTLPELRSRECRLCKLVCEAIDQYRKAEPYRRYGPGRLAFQFPEKDKISLRVCKRDLNVQFSLEVVKFQYYDDSLEEGSLLNGLGLLFGPDPLLDHPSLHNIKIISGISSTDFCGRDSTQFLTSKECLVGWNTAIIITAMPRMTTNADCPWATLFRLCSRV